MSKSKDPSAKYTKAYTSKKIVQIVRQIQKREREKSEKLAKALVPMCRGTYYITSKQVEKAKEVLGEFEAWKKTTPIINYAKTPV